jgi:hypothetical protein
VVKSPASLAFLASLVPGIIRSSSNEADLSLRVITRSDPSSRRIPPSPVRHPPAVGVNVLPCTTTGKSVVALALRQVRPWSMKGCHTEPMLDGSSVSAFVNKRVSLVCALSARVYRVAPLHQITNSR